MKAEEKDKYEETLLAYSSIVKYKKATREEIVECIKAFEYFEDYEKCKDLIGILDGIEARSKNDN